MHTTNVYIFFIFAIKAPGAGGNSVFRAERKTPQGVEQAARFYPRAAGMAVVWGGGC
jgi:hypothetical protein